MKGPQLDPRREDITWPNRVAPGGRRAPSTRNLKPQNSNLLILLPLRLSALQETGWRVVRVEQEGRATTFSVQALCWGCVCAW